MEKYYVIGAGISGSIIARKIAEELNGRVVLVDRRSHIGGNLYDEYIDGVLVQKYGPHFLLTNEWWIVDYLKRFSDFYECPAKAVSYIEGRIIDRPYNFRSLQQLMGPNNSQILLRKLRESFQGKRRVTLFELLSCSDEDIQSFALLMKEKIYSTYIAKQWGLKIEEIDQSIVNRAQFVLGYDTQLCELDYQYLPSNGFGEMFKKMLNHNNIELILNTDADKHIEFDNKKRRVLYDGHDVKALVYTGQIDSLFSFRHGALPYRSRKFELATYDEPQLFSGVVTYPKDKDYIRQTEYSKFNPVKSSKTVVQTEYSIKQNLAVKGEDEPYYPIINDSNLEIYKKYSNETKKYLNLFLTGRLAQFQYLDIDTAIMNAVKTFGLIKENS